MKRILQALGILALGLTILPPILFAAGSIENNTMKAAMIVGMLLWFATAPKWMKPIDTP